MKLRITVQGVSYDVDVEVLEDGSPAKGPASAPVNPRPAVGPSSPAAVVRPGATAGKSVPANAKIYAAPIPGVIVSIDVVAGSKVVKNGPMMVMESMKMETPVVAPFDGVIKTVFVGPRDSVKQGQPLVEYE